MVSPVSCCLSATGIRFSGHPVPPRSWAFLTVGLPNHDRSGPRRGFHVPHTQVTTGMGASYTPRTAMLTRPSTPLRPAPAASQRPVPQPCTNNPPTGTWITRRQRRFTQFTRPVFPSPVAPGWNENPWAFPELQTPPLPATPVGVGTGLRARARNYDVDISRPSHPQVHLQCATSCRTCSSIRR